MRRLLEIRGTKATKDLTTSVSAYTACCTNFISKTTSIRCRWMLRYSQELCSSELQ